MPASSYSIAIRLEMSNDRFKIPGHSLSFSDTIIVNDNLWVELQGPLALSGWKLGHDSQQDILLSCTLDIIILYL